MGAICLIDTSIFLEILNVPHKASQSELILQELKEKIEAGESLFLPMATILETGNHIAKDKKVDGNQRRTCAEKFVNQVTQALEGKSPFTPINFLKKEDLQGWLKLMKRWEVGDWETFLSFMIGKEFVIKIQSAASIYGLWTITLTVTISHRSYE